MLSFGGLSENLAEKLIDFSSSIQLLLAGGFSTIENLTYIHEKYGISGACIGSSFCFIKTNRKSILTNFTDINFKGCF